MKELWKAIAGFEAYEVSSLGRVRRRLPGAGGTYVGLILRQYTNRHGYMFVSLSSKSKGYIKKIHRLVALAFIPNPKQLPEVNHKGTKSDCRAIMLEWTDKRGNSIDAVKTGRISGDGISFFKESGKWMVRWHPKPGVREYLGLYSTFEEAKAVREAAVATL